MASHPTASPPRSGDLTSQAYDRLRQLIVDGRLSPGARLVECRLADRLGLSRTPIRSALQRLEQEGYVVQKETARQSHPYVAPLTADDAEELLLVLAQLEGAAARGAASLEPSERADLARKLAGFNDGLRRLVGEARVERTRFADLDRSLHQAMVDAAAGPRIGGLHSATRPQAERYFRLYALSLAEQVATSVRQHDELIEAVRQGDPDAAECAVTANWKGATRRLRDVIQRLGERGSW